MYLLDEEFEHVLGGVKIGDHTVLHRPDCGDIAGRPAQHHLGGLADGLNGFLGIRAGVLANGNHGRLVENDTFATNINEGICSAEIDREIGGEVLGEERKHVAFLNSERCCLQCVRMRQTLATAAKKLFFYTVVSPRQTGRFGQWTIIPYQFPKSMAIAGNLAANQQFFRGLMAWNLRQFRLSKS